MRCRYLIFFQYAGTKFSGVMKTPPHQGGEGVQNFLEDAVRKLRPVNQVSVSISSRTDTGVHALCNSAHVDIQRKDGRAPFEEDVLVDALNHHLKPEPIRAHHVPGDFNARYQAVSRTYVYRLATGAPHITLMPVTESGLCWSLRDTELDVDAMRRAATVLQGTHDFSSFRAINSETPFKNPLKTLDVVEMQPGTSFTQQHFYRDIQFWELTFKSRSFLYKQVRRMTGALVAVGRGKQSVSQVGELLEARDSLLYPQNTAAPPHGLFLTRVEYREADLRREQQHTNVDT
ncbi:tRNA pseudouridine synthase-like 1 isoform X2 [Denticeps clupeoides]|uniref:tRNA pseudouridine synthase-like 1 isoform X2 n=1 Tax=Denticeps clupeoides TaxID=299321 RepID=UPI0010A45696|nr:tRNA pseudouridine synthase-like 1 isoform X2 [Denticeps clupeoides]